MNTLSQNKSKGDQLAPYFQKKYGEILYSGTLALETALLGLGISNGDYVIVSENVCYRILLSVIRLGATPVIVNPKNKLILTASDVEKAINKFKVKAIILVHNLGIPVDVDSFRQKLGNEIFIIEDASQAWDVEYRGYKMGTHSDYVITSFGATKPLSLGVGGALFSNNKSFRDLLDFNDKNSRNNKNLIFPYVLPNSDDIDIQRLTAKAVKIIEKQRSVATVFFQELTHKNIKTWNLQDGDKASWHKFPIFTDLQTIYAHMQTLAQKYDIVFELPHKVKLSDIPLADKYHCPKIDNEVAVTYQVNISPQNNLDRLKLWIQNLNELKK